MNLKSNPLVSVIITTYNMEKYIGETLSSVVNQTYKNLEIIVVDDASEDKTLETVKSFAVKDNRIKYYVINHAGLPSATRNFGIEKSNADLIAFLDGDDIWTKNKLQEQVTFLLKHPELNFIYSMSVTFGEVSIFSPFYEVLPLLHKAAKTRDELIKNGNSISCSSVLAKTEVIKNTGGFDEDIKLKAVEDYDLWLRLSEIGSFGFIPRIQTYYRVHKNQSSSDWQTKQTRLKYLADKHKLNLPAYKFFRNKNIAIRLVRNLLHFLTFVWVKSLSLLDSWKLFAGPN
ncbi:MAG TPA: glycosyltransferase family A protein [Ignavibacteriaceae bacterium]|nr:glycosyltransferase family A protein [Ignavibacteriaceae bacterium]